MLKKIFCAQMLVLFFISPVFADWGEPVNFSEINSHSEENCALITPNSRAFYFGSMRSGGYGGVDLWVSYQDNQGRWRLPVNLGPNINSAGWDAGATLTPDGKTLYFCSTRLGDWKIFVSHRDAQDNWSAAEVLGPPINIDGSNSIDPILTIDGQKLYFASDRPGGLGNYDIYLSTFKDGEWSEPVNQTALNSRGLEARMSVSCDDQTMYLSRTSGTDANFILGGPGLDGLELWISTKDMSGQWNTPVLANSNINNGDNNSCPSVSLDENTLYFRSDRSGGLGQGDIWISQWESPIRLDIRRFPSQVKQSEIFNYTLRLINTTSNPVSLILWEESSPTNNLGQLLRYESITLEPNQRRDLQRTYQLSLGFPVGQCVWTAKIGRSFSEVIDRDSVIFEVLPADAQMRKE